MADPNAHHLNQHYLTQQSPPPPPPPQQQQQRGNQLVGSPVPHLMIDPHMQQVALAAAPPPPSMQHQFQPQHYNVLDNFWQQQVNEIRHGDHDFKVHQLPLARIKKVMKTDEEVKMISAEAPILFAKACDIFITELTMRAWHSAEECKRRTLQRSDIASAIKKIDMFDFLIDIVPREEKMNVKTEKMEYQDQNPYGFGLGLSQGGSQFDTSSSIPVDQKMLADPITGSLHEHQQHLQHIQYMNRIESQPQQILHDHAEHSNNNHHHQHPPFSLPPLNPAVAGQQVSHYRNPNRSHFTSISSEMNTGPSSSIRQSVPTTDYQNHHHSPFYNHSSSSSSSSSSTTSHNFPHHPINSINQRQSDNNHSVQVKDEYESRPLEWYSHNHQSYPQSSFNGGQTQTSSIQEFNHHENSNGMQFTRHDECFGRGGGGGQQRNINQ
ncbi:hypothetical protein Glove_121g60 [Diversispora epigaea]|uniref:Core Histone H2A/H2B/H3 domain-containing protein n=1 Tax=Diversispora epigaea TaxID=1348612 RepID=A0A397IZ81_9GLOM|nr:hypothetical protein Glove_121g60 [Diversispora epigaea]